jgi:hypothetical protein
MADILIASALLYHVNLWRFLCGGPSGADFVLDTCS